jgi:hypothetical protein
MGKSKNKESVQITAARITVIGAIVTTLIGAVVTIVVALIQNSPTENSSTTDSVVSTPTQLVAISTEIIAPTQTSSEVVNYFNANVAQWKLRGNADNIQLSFEDNLLRWEFDNASGGQRVAILDNTPIIDNFEYSADIKTISGDSQPSLVFRHSADGYYIFYLLPQSNMFSLMAWSNESGDWVPVIEWSKSQHINSELGAINTLKIIAKNELIRIFINGNEEGIKSDYTFNDGKIGVGIGIANSLSGEYEFSNFQFSIIAP